MKKNILAVLSSLVLAGCSTNHENYYLSNYSIKENLQSFSTSELAYKNIIYIQELTKKQAIQNLGPDASGYTVLFFSVHNLSDEPSYFDFKDALINNTYTGKSAEKINLKELESKHNIDLTKDKVYVNPFNKKQIEKYTFEYNLNQKVLTDFALQPNERKDGFLIFDKLKEPSNIQFGISSGRSIYTTRTQIVKIDNQ